MQLETNGDSEFCSNWDLCSESSNTVDDNFTVKNHQMIKKLKSICLFTIT